MHMASFDASLMAGELPSCAKQVGWRARWGVAVCAAASLWLAGCDQLGIETPQKSAAKAEAEAKAIGSACRHAVRAIEDCYTLNPKAEKSAIFAGWREMDEYMRENKLEGVPPQVPRVVAPAASKPAAAASDEEGAEDEEADDTAPKSKDGGKGAGKEKRKGASEH